MMVFIPGRNDADHDYLEPIGDVDQPRTQGREDHHKQIDWYGKRHSLLDPGFGPLFEHHQNRYEYG